MNPVVTLLNKVWDWSKSNWIIYVVVIIVGVAVWQHMIQSDLIQNLAKQNQEEFARHTQDLAELRQTYEHEHAAQEAINQQYNQTLQQLQTDYNTRLTQLETQTTQRRQRFVTETSGHPDEMASRLRQRLGWGTP